MEITKDYLPRAKLPILVLIVLFLVQTVLITSLDLFTDLSQDPTVNIWVLGGINFAFILCALLIVAWAGLRTVRATNGGPIDGAMSGAITAIVAGFIVRVASIMFSISTLPVLISSAEPTGVAAAGILGFLGIFLGFLGIIVGFFIDLIAGALFGGIGAIVHERTILGKHRPKQVVGSQGQRQEGQKQAGIRR